MHFTPVRHPVSSSPLSKDAAGTRHDRGVSRRQFVQLLGGGLVVSVYAAPSAAQRRQQQGGDKQAVSARIHVAHDGAITVMTGKVEMGQGARTELTQAAAEELRVPVGHVHILMADTSLVPDDGTTAGSRTTPSTVPAVRRGAAAARELLVELACRQWHVKPDEVQVRDGTVQHAATQRAIGYGQLAQSEDLDKLFQQPIDSDVELTAVSEWKVLGKPARRVNARDLVTGAHRFPSDMFRPNMLYGKVLRPPSYGAKLASVDLDAARAMPGVVVVQDDSLIGVAAPNSRAAQQALDALAATAVWQPALHPSSSELFDYLREHTQEEVPANTFADQLTQAKHVLRQSYHAAYVQHAPMETRAALAEWTEGALTVWTGTQSPFGYHRELVQALRLAQDQVRVIVPDFGGGFGGKHTGEAAIEAARLARGAGRPVLLTWTREEEFTWAYFRPAAVIDVEASLDDRGLLTSWHFTNINSGRAALDTPYRVAKNRSSYVAADAPLRQGSYRVLAATANNFAREVAMDELAEAAGADPLEFRLAHLDHPRLRAALQDAARRFDWPALSRQKKPGWGVGLACGTEKGSFVAACVEIALSGPKNQIQVRRVCQTFECGAILNPDNLRAQVESCIIMGLGPALREEMLFEDGKMINARFAGYEVPRMSDLPELEVHLLDRPDLASAGGGETPLIAVAPAIAGAVFHATGQRIRQIPIRLPA